jgi:NADH-quinone oxidoreductase subunit N
MKIQDILLMRQEILLTLMILFILVGEIIRTEYQLKRYLQIYIGLFTLITLIGFIPQESGTIFGGMYHTDNTFGLLKNILNIGTLIVLLQSMPWLETEPNKNKSGEFYILLLSTLVGMDFMISSQNFLMMYLGLELASIPIAILAGYEKMKNQSAEAGIKYIFMSALSSGILLFGISMIYGTTGSIDFKEISERFSAESLPMLGFIFFVAGMGFKISLVPFHLWTADVYEGSPISVTAFLSVISKGAAVFVFTFILYHIFGNFTQIWHNVLYVLAILTMTIGNLFALRQNNIKRFLAFSSIAQAGFILLGIIGSDAKGMASVIYFILVYLFTNLGAFGVVAAISNASGKENIEDYKGFYKTNPRLSWLMTLALFSLAGIPPVAGFFGKFFLFMSAASAGFYILVLIAVLNVIISLYYYLRVVKAMFIDKSEEPIPYFVTAPSIKIGMVICLAGIIIIGLVGGVYEYVLGLSGGISNIF